MARIHIMRLQEQPFGAIASNEKTIELRLYDQKRRGLRVGDIIEFSRVDENVSESRGATARDVGHGGCREPEHDSAGGSECGRIVREVVALHVFSSFDELYAHLPLERCGYTAAEVAAGLARAEDMRMYYSAEDEALWGVVGIELQRVADADSDPVC